MLEFSSYANEWYLTKHFASFHFWFTSILQVHISCLFLIEIYRIVFQYKASKFTESFVWYAELSSIKFIELLCDTLEYTRLSNIKWIIVRYTETLKIVQHNAHQNFYLKVAAHIPYLPIAEFSPSLVFISIMLRTERYTYLRIDL